MHYVLGEATEILIRTHLWGFVAYFKTYIQTGINLGDISVSLSYLWHLLTARQTASTEM